MLEDTLVDEDIHPVYVSAAATDRGRVRSTNQDSVRELTRSGLWVVADGMGGYRDGDVASRMVCEALEDLDAGSSFEDAIESIRRRMSDVNTRLHAVAVRPVDPVVSGSTVAMLLVRRSACAVLWAGDSRAYRLRHRQLHQLTTDHTRAAQLQLGSSGDEADHALIRAVGGEDTLQLDVRRDHVQVGDRYLVCSDGLNHELGDEQIAELLAQGDVRQCARSLIEATLQAGAHDNVTVVVVDAT